MADIALDPSEIRGPAAALGGSAVSTPASVVPPVVAAPVVVVPAPVATVAEAPAARPHGSRGVKFAAAGIGLVAAAALAGGGLWYSSHARRAPSAAAQPQVAEKAQIGKFVDMPEIKDGVPAIVGTKPARAGGVSLAAAAPSGGVPSPAAAAGSSPAATAGSSPAALPSASSSPFSPMPFGATPIRKIAITSPTAPVSAERPADPAPAVPARPNGAAASVLASLPPPPTVPDAAATLPTSAAAAPAQAATQHVSIEVDPATLRPSAPTPDAGISEAPPLPPLRPTETRAMASRPAETRPAEPRHERAAALDRRPARALRAPGAPEPAGTPEAVASSGPPLPLTPKQPAPASDEKFDVFGLKVPNLLPAAGRSIQGAVQTLSDAVTGGPDTP